MTATQESACPVAAALALVLAEVLGLGLPDPSYITVNPGCADSVFTPAFGLQFSRTPEGRKALAAWAAHFGVTVCSTLAPEDRRPGQIHDSAFFSASGVRFHAYGYFDKP
jgi:hypothetical protein